MSRPVPIGTWMLAGTPVNRRYPCQCHRRNRRDCRSKWCICWGRDDVADLPPLCCGPKHPKHAKPREDVTA